MTSAHAGLSALSRLVLASASFLLGLSLWVSAAQAAIAVNISSDGPVPQTNDQSCSLREAVQAVNTQLPVNPAGGNDCPNTAPGPANLIRLPAGSITLTTSVVLSRSMEIRGAGMDTSVINADQFANHEGYAIAVFGPLQPQVTFSRVTLQAGAVSFTSGFFVAADPGVPNDATRLALADVRVAGFTNSGLWNQAAALVVEYSIIEDNAGGVPGGGGIHVASNTPPDPGVIQPGFLVVSRSAIVNNAAEGDGGGIYFQGGSNSRMEESTISGNFAAGRGGGLYSNGRDYLNMFHVTVAFNQAAVSGGGATGERDTSAIRSQTDIWSGNTAPLGPDVQGNFFVHEGLISVRDAAHDGSIGDAGSGTLSIVGVPARLGPLTSVAFSDERGTHRTKVNPLLAPTPAQPNPAVDYLPPQSSVDQRGVARPQDGDAVPGAGADIGSYELDPNEPVMKFETLASWSSSAPLSLNSVRKTQGQFGLSVGGSGYRVVNGSALRTPLGLVSTLGLDVFVPGNQPNPFWLGAVQMYATCASANLNNAYLGQVELTGKPTGAFSTLNFVVPASVRNVLGQVHTDCFFSIAVNTNPTPVAPVLDNLRVLP